MKRSRPFATHSSMVIPAVIQRVALSLIKDASENNVALKGRKSAVQRARVTQGKFISFAEPLSN